MNLEVFFKFLQVSSLLHARPFNKSFGISLIRGVNMNYEFCIKYFLNDVYALKTNFKRKVKVSTRT